MKRGKAMVRLNKDQLLKKKQFILDYMIAGNAADGSKMDSNANVSSKNIATLSAELNKDINIQINRSLIYDKILNIFDKETADEYIRQLEHHEIYTHDETSLMPYCVSISMYPFLLDGLKGFGGESKAPKHLSSFNGGFINLVFAIAAQFAGAVATVEYLMYFDHFARKEYGDDYLNSAEKIVEQELQQVVYALNQPAAARGFQSVFWNISIYDKYYFDAMFSNFVFPDGDKPNWNTLDKLQRFFMKWFNKERTKAVLTFPVVTAACLNDGVTFKDAEYKKFIANELAEGNSFFIFNSDSAYALASCCFYGDETIEVLNTLTNKNEILSISDFVNLYNKEEHEQKINDTTYSIKSLNPESLEEEYVKITGTLKKKNEYNKLISFKISNKEIRVTPDHLFLVKNKETNVIEERRADFLICNFEKYMLPM
jgi:ribonucleoside-triphosphate reductase